MISLAMIYLVQEQYEIPLKYRLKGIKEKYINHYLINKNIKKKIFF